MKKILTYLPVILGIVLFDQIIKCLVLHRFFELEYKTAIDSIPWFINNRLLIEHPLMPGSGSPYQITDFFNVMFTWNPGTSFSMFQRLGDALPLVIILMTSFIIGFILYYLFRRAEKYECLPLALIAGGALGNLIDRIRFGAVIDFLDFHIGTYHWPAFNVADTFICIGVGLYVLNWFLARRRLKK